MAQRVNIIYLTTKCNIACEYCYEGNGDADSSIPSVFLSNDQIDEFVDEMEKAEGGVKSSSIAIMGGEPTLAYDGLEYFINRIIKSSKKLDKSYFAVLTTNGILLDNDVYYKKFINLLKHANDNKFGVSLEVSYDGIGHSLRKFKDGSSTQETVKRVLNKLEKDGNRFRVSYTVSEKNYLVVIEDVIRLLETYKNLYTITCNIAFSRLDNFFRMESGFKIKDELKPYMKELYQIYNIPICGLACGPCKVCNPSTFEGHRFISPTKGITCEESVTQKEFDKF